jgi:hypothetical protein
VYSARILRRSFQLTAVATSRLSWEFQCDQWWYSLFQISLDGASSYNAFADIGSSGSTNNFNVEERFNINDVAYWTKGDKTWKFGVDLSRARLNVIPFFGASGGRWEFRTLNTDRTRANNVAAGGNSLASLLIGVPIRSRLDHCWLTTIIVGCGRSVYSE